MRRDVLGRLWDAAINVKADLPKTSDVPPVMRTGSEEELRIREAFAAGFMIATDNPQAVMMRTNDLAKLAADEYAIWYEGKYK